MNISDILLLWGGAVFGFVLAAILTNNDGGHGLTA